jgi:hypothetical protein
MMKEPQHTLRKRMDDVKWVSETAASIIALLLAHVWVNKS